MPVRGDFQRSELLDLTGLQCGASDVEAGILHSLNGNKFSGVVLPRHSLQASRQRSSYRTFLGQPKASSAIGAKHAQEVPAHLANHRIQDRRRDLFHKLPVVSDGLREGIQTIREDAVLAQED